MSNMSFCLSDSVHITKKNDLLNFWWNTLPCFDAAMFHEILCCHAADLCTLLTLRWNVCRRWVIGTTRRTIANDRILVASPEWSVESRVWPSFTHRNGWIEWIVHDHKGNSCPSKKNDIWVGSSYIGGSIMKNTTFDPSQYNLDDSHLWILRWNKNETVRFFRNFQISWEFFVDFSMCQWSKRQRIAAWGTVAEGNAVHHLRDSSVFLVGKNPKIFEDPLLGWCDLILKTKNVTQWTNRQDFLKIQRKFFDCSWLDL